MPTYARERRDREMIGGWKRPMDEEIKRGPW
jgi:hypothetical protein